MKNYSSTSLDELIQDIFGDLLLDETITEISCNQPNVLWVARRGSLVMHKIETQKANIRVLNDFYTLVAEYTHQTKEKPLLSAQIPFLNTNRFLRVQFVLSPITPPETMGISIRKPTIQNLEWNSYQSMFGRVKKYNEISDDEKKLRSLYHNKELWEFTAQAILMKKNIIISAGTDNGKSTLLNSMLSIIPEHERLGIIEDVRELSSIHENVLSMLFSRGNLTTFKVDVTEILEACLRLRFDRILMGEIRGAEVFTFLNLILSGISGTMTTIHAGSVKECFEKLIILASQNGAGLPESQVRRLVEMTVDIIIQMKRTPDGDYGIEQIYYNNQGELFD